MKRILCIMIVSILIISQLTTPAAAYGITHNENIVKLDEGEILLDVHRYDPNGKQIRDSKNIGVFAVPDPDVGSVDIVDTLYKESGYQDEVTTKFTDFKTFKKASITVITKIPIVGKYVATGLDIWESLCDVYSDLNKLNPSKNVKIITKYTYRDFYHKANVFNDAHKWQFVGQSISRYYYPWYYITYYNDIKGEFDDTSYHFSHSNGYKPTVIAKAPHYMDYKGLRYMAIDSWKSGISFSENYFMR